MLSALMGLFGGEEGLGSIWTVNGVTSFCCGCLCPCARARVVGLPNRGLRGSHGEGPFGPCWGSRDRRV